MYRVIILLGFFLTISEGQYYAPRHYGVIPPQKVIDESPKPYQFAYEAEAIGGSSARQETADGSGTVVGSYTLNDEDGRSRVVQYVADEAGFRANVKTNEPGTKSESPADVPVESSAPDTPDVYKSSLPYSGYAGRYGGLGYAGRYGTLGYGNLGYAGRLGYGGLGYAGRLGYGGLGYAGHLGHGGLYNSLGYAGRYGHHGYPYGYQNRPFAYDGHTYLNREYSALRI